MIRRIRIAAGPRLPGLQAKLVLPVALMALLAFGQASVQLMSNRASMSSIAQMSRSFDGLAVYQHVLDQLRIQHADAMSYLQTAQDEHRQRFLERSSALEARLQEGPLLELVPDFRTWRQAVETDFRIMSGRPATDRAFSALIESVHDRVRDERSRLENDVLTQTRFAEFAGTLRFSALSPRWQVHAHA